MAYMKSVLKTILAVLFVLFELGVIIIDFTEIGNLSRLKKQQKFKIKKRKNASDINHLELDLTEGTKSNNYSSWKKQQKFKIKKRKNASDINHLELDLTEETKSNNYSSWKKEQKLKTKKRKNASDINHLELDLTEETNSNNCSSWKLPKFVKKYLNPSIYLDPNKYLYPGVIWGPNNQILGLKSAIYLAIRINRTLVLPQFHAQWTHPGKLSPYQMIDVEKLCKFISCISIEQLRESCNSSFDVAFEGMPCGRFIVKKFENDTGMSVFYPKHILQNITSSRKLRLFGNNTHSQIPTLPNSNLTAKYPLFPSDAVVIKSAFDTFARCAIHVCVYVNFKVSPKLNLAFPLKPGSFKNSNISDDLLFSAITDAIRRPPCIVNAARDYIRTVLRNDTFVGVHWRYDKKDWLARICPHNFTWSRRTCKIANNTKPIHLAKAIVNSVKRDMARKKSKVETIPVYLAMPSSLKIFKNDTYNELKRFDERFLEPTTSLDSFLNESYKVCWEQNGWTNIEEVKSLMEMEIMIRGSWFLFSHGSSWSSNVIQFRKSIDDHGKINKKFSSNVINVLLKEVRTN